MGAPTLLVGLGGSGSDVVQAVYRKATDKQKEQISFVIFDTDVNELRGIEDEMPLIRTVQVSTRLTVGEYLDVDQYARDNWFPVNHILGGKSLTEGAGQVRAISRLFFLSSAHLSSFVISSSKSIAYTFRLPREVSYTSR